MSLKTSIYLDDLTVRILAARDPESGDSRRNGRRSRLLREFTRRYDEICQKDLPQLDEAEWDIVLRVGKEWATTEDPTPLNVLLGSLVETCRHSPGGAALVDKVVRLTTGERTAILDYVERYWAAKAKKEKPPLPSRSSAAPDRKTSVRT